ncbi:class F sortase [Modestobacter lapidis]|nr:class F sortase [Modestobacter lapidis]
MRGAHVVLVLGLVGGLGAPAAWAVGRPADAAGPAVAEVLAAAPPGAPAPRAPADWVPEVTLRSAMAPPVPEVPAPARLVVPSIGVDAPVDPVGVSGTGAMRIPADVDRVGWYEHGPAPGDGAGSVVLAGHVDSRTQGLGAMAALRTAEVGAEVRVLDEAGTVSRWRVVARETLHKQQLPTAELFTRSGPRRLVLLTCGGPFDEELRSYRDNVVVLAEPVP